MRRLAIPAAALLIAACGEGSEAATVTTASAATLSGPRGTVPRAADPAERTFRDWYVACDNGNACYAFGHGIEATGWVRISIPAGPDGRPTVAVGFWPENGGFGGPVTARVDGRVFAALTDADAGEDAAPVATVDPDGVPQLIGLMARGEAMSLNAGSETVAISLSGVAASLLWIDERQGRLGTTTALIRKGDRPASAVPPAPALPRIAPAPAVSQAGYGDQEGQTLPAAIEALPEVVQCRADTEFNPDLQKVIASARLDAGTVLWSVPCGVGAYNFASAWFTTDPSGANPRRVMFPTTGEPLEFLVNAAYDPARRVIDAFDKGRGLGDCGTASSWTWTTRGFVLKSSAGMPDCNGVPSDYWPMFWVTE